MATKTVYTRATHAEINLLLREVLGGITGALVPRARKRYRSLFYGHIARSMFDQIETAYLVKATGGVDDLGNEYEKLSPATLKKKRKKYPKTYWLRTIASGRQLRSFRPRRMQIWSYPSRSGGDQVYRMTSKGFSLGSRVPHTRYHQSGTVRMPARPPIPENHGPWLKKAVADAVAAVVERFGGELP